MCVVAGYYIYSTIGKGSFMVEAHTGYALPYLVMYNYSQTIAIYSHARHGIMQVKKLHVWTTLLCYTL